MVTASRGANAGSTCDPCSVRGSAFVDVYESKRERFNGISPPNDIYRESILCCLPTTYLTASVGQPRPEELTVYIFHSFYGQTILLPRSRRFDWVMRRLMRRCSAGLQFQYPIPYTYIRANQPCASKRGRPLVTARVLSIKISQAAREGFHQTRNIYI